MRLIVSKLELERGLKKVDRIVPSRSARPVLQNVVVSTNGGIDLAGTDLEVGIRYHVAAKIEEHGTACLPAGRFKAAVKSLAKGDVAIQYDPEGTFELAGGRARFELATEDPEEFPVVPAFPETKAIRIGAETFRALVERAAFAAAAEETRYAIHGVLLEFAGKKVTAVGTNGKRLAAQIGECRGNRGKRSALVPQRALLAILREIPKKTTRVDPDLGDVEIVLEERRVLLRYRAATIIAARIEGTFPNYEEVTPRDPKWRAELDVAELETALAQCSVLATDSSQAVSLAFGPGKVTVSARASNVGKASTEIDVLSEEPYEPADIHFNPGYLSEFLKATPDERITLAWNDPRSAVRLDDTAGATYVVMPVTLESVE